MKNHKSLMDIYSEIKKSIVDYIDTLYFTKSEEFNEQRRNLLYNDINGPMFQKPRIEFLRSYQLSQKQFLEIIEGDEVLGKIEVTKKESFEEFFKQFTPVEKGTLYKHQVDSLENILIKNRNIVVTTGTGSGKSYCFMIPLLATIVKEGMRTTGKGAWSGNPLNLTKWWERTPRKFVQKRNLTSRKAAVRCLVMYPLNALVQDQVDELRTILNSKAALNFYDKCLGKDRIFFGQYSGSTSGGGSSEDASRLAEVASEFEEIDSFSKDRSQIASSDEKKTSIVQLDGSELLTRWDMQVTPPDIMITNYSMLSIMLHRDGEQNIFEETRQWLLESKENKFTLVLDELHSYRGTGGTEISFIIKTFLKKIGLHAKHEQLHIICTSASLESEHEGEDSPFLSEFFGLENGSNEFELIKGDLVDLSDTSQCKKILKGKMEAFKEFGKSEIGLADLISQVAGEQSVDDFGLFLNSLCIEDALIELSLFKAKIKTNIETYSLTVQEISDHFFSGDYLAGKGLIDLITSESELISEFKGKARLHLFVKNLDAIRVSSDRTSGLKVYHSDVHVCRESSALNFEAMYCQECGENYFRGYLVKGSKPKQGRTQKYTLSTEPILKRTTDQIKQVIFSFNESDQGVFEKSSPSLMDHESGQDEPFGGWSGSYKLNTTTGQLVTGSRASDEESFANIVTFFCESTRGRLESYLPSKCYSCETDWSSLENKLITRRIS